MLEENLKPWGSEAAEGAERLDYSDEEPNEETLQAMRELEREMDDLPSYGSYEEAMAVSHAYGHARRSVSRQEAAYVRHTQKPRMA